jgi:ferredoxin
MNISRKEFLAGWLAPFGKLLSGADQVSGQQTSAVEEFRVSGALLRIDQGQCLARSGGCFTCLEQCPQEAISLIPGHGISIEVAQCSGCGHCVEICPLAPAVLRFEPDETSSAHLKLGNSEAV